MPPPSWTIEPEQRDLRRRDYGSSGAKIRTYDIVASSGKNLRAGKRNAPAPEEAAA
jgi:hypothetical protein